MPVRIDHARHQRAPAAVHHIGVSDLVRMCNQRFDQIALNEDALAFDKLTTGTVEDIHVLEQNWLSRALRESGAGGTGGKRRKACGHSLQNRTTGQANLEAREQLLCLRFVALATPRMGKLPTFGTQADRQSIALKTCPSHLCQPKSK